MRSRVVPGISSTIAMRSPIMRLKNVDLPTFGRPTIATSGFIMYMLPSLHPFLTFRAVRTWVVSLIRTAHRLRRLAHSSYAVLGGYRLCGQWPQSLYPPNTAYELPSAVRRSQAERRPE